MPAVASDEKSVRELFSELVAESSALIRKEVQLARVEMMGAVREIKTSVMAMAFGGVVAFAGLLMLLNAAALALDLWLMRPWLSALIVGGVAVAIGGAVAAGGRKGTQVQSLKPERTLQSLQEDGQLVRRHMGA
jgi:hypothetical protein